MRLKLSEEEKRHRDYLADKRGRYPVTFQCGHSAAVPVWDVSKAADSPWIQKLRSGDCCACWRNKQLPTFRLSTDSTHMLVSHGYPIRQQLTARGYRFRSPDWSKQLTTEAAREEEMRWIGESGFALNQEHTAI